MISTAELERLMDASIKHPEKEDAFFLALLDGTVFVHVPHTDKRDGILRIATFPRPGDGLQVVPMFTSEVKAQWAARGAVRLLPMTGRFLMQATRGATLMINPNSASCTLYPEEVRALLDSGTIATFNKIDTGSMLGAQCYAPDSIPRTLLSALAKILPTVSFVECAYVMGLRSATQKRGFVVTLMVDKNQGERAVRAVLTGILSTLKESDIPIDVTFSDTSEPVPKHVADLKLKPVYERVWARMSEWRQ